MIGARSQDEFVAARRQDWQELDHILLDGGDSLAKKDGAAISRLAALYRSLCTDLMRARAARYTPDLTAYLDALAARAHATLYGAEPFRLPDVVSFFTRDFPRALRQNARFFAIACALFFLPSLVGIAGALASDEFAAHVLPSSVLQGMAQMYSEGPSGRDAGTDTGMAGFYVFNNVGIAFRCFATGVLFGAGSIFFLIYNGLFTGTVVGHVMSVGHGGNIWTFMCSHAPFELTAIVIAGGAGLEMGYALVETRGRTRVGSLRRAAPSIVRQVLGAAAMLLIAAGIEGFWSPSGLPPPVKWAASGVFSLLIVLYLALAGRSAEEAPR
ncbi:stage II sporulation protein M [Sorangium sp. So ce124]|uniref:stage II sporulation protein M n=1 Tax=Sorangium sp. So ce124 TaxID=3133280 RepID=UPI003F5F954A